MADSVTQSNNSRGTSSLGVLQEHSKTVITLATSFLGLTVAFAGTILGQNPPRLQIILLAVVWLLLTCVILTAIISVVQIYKTLQKDEVNTDDKVDPKVTRRRAASTATLSYLILALAGVVFGIIGILRLYNSKGPIDAMTASKQAIEFLSSSANVDKSKITLERITLDESARTYRIIATADTSKTFEIVADATNASIKDYQTISGYESAPRQTAAPDVSSPGKNTDGRKTSRRKGSKLKKPPRTARRYRRFRAYGKPQRRRILH